MRGRVSSSSGRPLPSVRMSLWNGVDENGEVPGILHYQSNTLTDPQGRYEWIGLEPGPYLVEARMDGYAMFTDVVRVPAGQSVDIVRDIVLRPEARLIVAVRDRAGETVEASLVRVTPVGIRAMSDWKAEEVGGGRSDWLIRALPSGEVEVRTEAPGFFPAVRRVVVSEGKESKLVVRLRRLGSLEVRIKAMEGGARGGWPFELIDEETGESVSDWIGDRGVTSSTGGLVTDEDGRVTIENLPEGRYLLTSGTARRHVEVVAGQRVETSLTLFE